MGPLIPDSLKVNFRLEPEFELKQLALTSFLSSVRLLLIKVFITFKKLCKFKLGNYYLPNFNIIKRIRYFENGVFYSMCHLIIIYFFKIIFLLMKFFILASIVCLCCPKVNFSSFWDLPMLSSCIDHRCRFLTFSFPPAFDGKMQSSFCMFLHPLLAP